MSLAAWQSELTYGGWKHVPSMYLICKKDEAIPFPVQERMLTAIGEGVLKREICDSGHGPMLRMLEKVVEVIKRAAGEEFA